MPLGQNTESIFNMQPFVSRMPHAVTSRHERLPVQGNTTLTRPAVHPNERHVIVGTSDEKKGPHALILVDTEIMESNMFAKPVVSQQTVEGDVILTQWIGRDRLLAFSGTREDPPTTMSMFKVNVEGKGEFELQESIILDNAIRETAMNQAQSNLGVYGGSENKLYLVDFNAGLQPTKTFLTDSGVSSVRWTQFHEGSLISATTEAGQVNLFDVNASKDSPVWTYKGDLGVHKALYTHCQISDHQLLLGYEDNYMEAIDIRMPHNGLANFMTGAFDPFCQMIGDMHYREASGYLLVSGMADFSVYKHDRFGAEKNVARLWCHSANTQNSNKQDANGTAFNTVFLRDNWLVSSHEVLLSLYKLD